MPKTMGRCPNCGVNIYKRDAYIVSESDVYRPMTYIPVSAKGKLDEGDRLVYKCSSCQQTINPEELR